MRRYDSEKTRRASDIDLAGLGKQSFGNEDEWQGYYALVSDTDGWSIIHVSQQGFVKGWHDLTESEARGAFEVMFRRYCEDQAKEGV